LFRPVDELVGQALHLREKVFVPDLQSAANPFVDAVGVPEGEVTGEDDAIEARQLQTDIRLPLVGKLLTEDHGGVPCAREVDQDNLQQSTERRFVKCGGPGRSWGVDQFVVVPPPLGYAE
jgi:hypothetical protein